MKGFHCRYSGGGSCLSVTSESACVYLNSQTLMSVFEIWLKTVNMHCNK